MIENILVAELQHCHVYGTRHGALTIFKEDATTSANWPPDDAAFASVARDCGFDDDLIGYVIDHDLSHSFLSERMWGAPSPVLWSAAHQNHIERTASLFEERWVYHWQRFARGLIPALEPEWKDWLPDYLALREGSCGMTELKHVGTAPSVVAILDI